MAKVYDIKALRAEYEKNKREKESVKFHLLIRWENKDGNEYREINHYNEIEDLIDDIKQNKMDLFIEHYRSYPSPILLCVDFGGTPLYVSTVYDRMTAGEIMHQIVDTAKSVLDLSRRS
jgi:hypothetical protein|nr:MAG TPA: hypothetical protein [Caudoviricetes sp.]